MDRISPSVYERADEGLLKLLKKAESSALTDEEINLYEASMKRLEDEIDMKEYGFEIGMEKGLKEGRAKGLEEGREEGMKEGMKATILLLQNSGMTLDEIQERLQLTQEDINKLNL